MLARRFTALTILALLAPAACSDDPTSPTGPIPEDVPVADGIFLDDFAASVTYEAFTDSKVDAVEIDLTVAYRGASSLKVTVPAEGDPSGFYSGGALVAAAGMDFSAYNAVSFWVMADREATLNVAGLANDNTGASPFMVEVSDLEVSGVWRKYFIPIPNPAVLTSEAGLFYFAEAHEGGEGYTLWFDDIRFESMADAEISAAIASQDITVELGGTARVDGLTVTMAAQGRDATVAAGPDYFTFASSDEAVATVAEDGTITVVGPGTAVITAALGSVDASGSVTVTMGQPLSTPAPTPPHDAANVVSLYSNAYTNVTVDTWSADWDQADVSDDQVAGDDIKLYTNLVYAGIEFTSSTIDATAMTHFHMDLWTPDATDGGELFKIKLVDFGANGVWDGGGDDVEHEVTIAAPPLATKEWVSLDIPLSDFTGLTTRGAMAQLIISGDLGKVYIDNVLFYKDVLNPLVAAPTPSHAEADVISMFSDAYTDVTMGTWSADWDDADVEDVLVAGNATKKYSNLAFAGIEPSPTFDATEMTHFRFDFWTPDPTDGGEVFKVKLVDFGANGVWDGGGDDVEHELFIDNTYSTPLATGNWVSFDIPLSEFTGLTTRGAMAQLIISGDVNTVFLDNIYFRK